MNNESIERVRRLYEDLHSRREMQNTEFAVILGRYIEAVREFQIKAEREACVTQLENAAMITKQHGNKSDAALIRGLAQSLRARK